MGMPPVYDVSMKRRALCQCVLFAITAVLPAVAQTTVPMLLSIVNGTNAGVPTSVAPGSIVTLYVQSAGPATLISAPKLPLTTSLPDNANGVAVQFVSGGTVYKAPILYAISTQIGAIVPSGLPLGVALVTVQYQGVSSNSQSVVITSASVGIFAQNQQGYGPAAAQNYVNSSLSIPNGLSKPALPAQIVTLYATGLGASLDGNDSGAPKVGTIRADVAITIGSVTVTPLYAGRSPQYPGLDQINFQLPGNSAMIAGCYVPVTVTANGITSPTVTIAVSQSATCSHPLGLAASALAALDAGKNVNVGTVTLMREGFQVSGQPYTAPVLQSDYGNASFLKLNADGVFQTTQSTLGLGSGPPAGTCMVSSVPIVVVASFRTSNYFQSGPMGLDAGPSISLLSFVSPSPVTMAGAAGYYATPTDSSGNGPAFLAGGPWTLAVPGGPGLQAFNVSFLVPTIPQWTNAAQFAGATISRANPLTVTWTGGGPSDTVTITGTSLNYDTSSAAFSTQQAFVCSAPASAGTFTVPPSILSSMHPQAATAGQYSASLGLSLVSRLASFNAPLTAGGSLDAGIVTFNYSNVRLVAWQ